MDATPTAFSVYGEFGIELGLREGYYVLPKRELSTGDVFIHSLDSAKDVSQKLYCILFYLKYKGELKGVRHPMLRKIRAVLIKENRRGFPSYEEVMERVELYAIEH